MQTVAETKYYAQRAEKLLSADERKEVVDLLATDPLAGEVMVGTGGIRKLRFGKANKGKSGGVRVIYYFYNDHVPLYLVEIFAKNEKDNLSKAESNALVLFSQRVKQRAREKHYG